MEGYKTIREASAPDQLDRSPAWIRAAIKHGRIKAEPVNKRLILIADSEIQRIKDNPFTISRVEMQ